MDSRIYIHRYTLRSKNALNAKTAKNIYHGALLRVEKAGICCGYGCIHPWVELGDLDLDNTLKQLSEGVLTPLSERALDCAKEDAQARMRNVSIFNGLSVPESHATIPMDSWSLYEAVDSGFNLVKLKVGRDLAKEAFFLHQCSARHPDLKWRLDFNQTQPVEVVRDFLLSLGDFVRAKIDFIEDAYLSGSTAFADSDLSVNTAVDREVASLEQGYQVKVIKPALSSFDGLLSEARTSGQRAIFTSYMDHPVGQTYAAWQAACGYANYPELRETCGLVTQGLFECDGAEGQFIEALGEPKPRFQVPNGSGLGFDDLLEDLSWEKLV